AGGAGVHVQGFKQLLFHELIPGSSIDIFDYLSRQRIHDIIVHKTGTEGFFKIHKPHLIEYVVPGSVGHEMEAIPQDATQPGPVSECVSDSHFAGHPRVFELDPRDVIGDFVIPVDFSPIDKDTQGGGGHIFTDRGDTEYGMFVYWFAEAQSFFSETFSINDFPAFDYAYRHARYFPVIPCGFDPFIQVSGQTVLRKPNKINTTQQ